MGVLTLDRGSLWLGRFWALCSSQCWFLSPNPLGTACRSHHPCPRRQFRTFLSHPWAPAGSLLGDGLEWAPLGARACRMGGRPASQPLAPRGAETPGHGAAGRGRQGSRGHGGRRPGGSTRAEGPAQPGPGASEDARARGDRGRRGMGGPDRGRHGGARQPRDPRRPRPRPREPFRARRDLLKVTAPAQASPGLHRGWAEPGAQPMGGADGTRTEPAAQLIGWARGTGVRCQKHSQ